MEFSKDQMIQSKSFSHQIPQGFTHLLKALHNIRLLDAKDVALWLCINKNDTD